MSAKIRVGDIIRTKELGRTYRLAIVESIQGWSVAKGMASVKFRGNSIGSLVNLDRCKLYTQREQLTKWWLWL